MSEKELVLRYEVSPENSGLNQIYFALLDERRNGLILVADTQFCENNVNFHVLSRRSMGYCIEMERAKIIYNILIGKVEKSSSDNELFDGSEHCETGFCGLPRNAIYRGMGDLNVKGEKIPIADILMMGRYDMDELIENVKTYSYVKNELYKAFDPIPV